MSVNQTWGTPKKFFEYLRETHAWLPDLDAAASSSNAKAKHFITETENSLEMDWFGNVWLNPPFGRMLPKFLLKCKEQIQRDEVKSIFVLIPARTDTKWFHEIIMNSAKYVYLIKGRFNFESPYAYKGANAPFPSMLIVYEKNIQDTTIKPLTIDKLYRGWDI